jgi:hypothetical protein
MYSSIAATHTSLPYKMPVSLQSELLAVENRNAGPAGRSGDTSHATNSVVPTMAEAACTGGRNSGRGGRR